MWRARVLCTIGAIIGVIVGGPSFGLIGAGVGAILGWLVVAGILKRWGPAPSAPPESLPPG